MLFGSPPSTLAGWSNPRLADLGRVTPYRSLRGAGCCAVRRQHLNMESSKSSRPSFVLRASIEIDNKISSSERNDGTTIHGVSEKVVGVLGGGQLGRMLCQAASMMAIKIMTLDPMENCPASSLSYHHFVGRFDDGDAIWEFAKRCDVLTIEIEHVDAIALEKLEGQGIDCQPKPATIRIIQVLRNNARSHNSRGRGISCSIVISRHHGAVLFPEMELHLLLQLFIIFSSQHLSVAISFKSWLINRRKVRVKTSGVISSKGHLFFHSSLFNILCPWTQTSDAQLVNDYAILQDKYIQKVHFSQNGIPLPDFLEIDNLESAEKAGNYFGYPMMVKSRRHAYDGRGNAVAHSKEDLHSTITAMGGFGRGLYAERWTPFTKELSVIVARGRDGSVLCYPVVETVHKDNICHIVEAPARVPGKVEKLAVDIACRAVNSLEGAGVFAVELFLIQDGQVLLNEVAPRPHNSGHHTIESCYTSQYEQHLRAVIGLPLGDTSMKVPAAVMYNILGEDVFSAKCLFPALFVAQLGVTPQVAVIMGSDSDLPTMNGAAEILEYFNVPFKITIVSAHRTPVEMYSFALSAKERGIKIIIAGAGGAAHLPGMVASLTPLPVIGVPIRTSSLFGVDSLLSIVQMPHGIPVATVAIGNAANAALLAVRILSLEDEELSERLINYQEDMKNTVVRKVEKLEVDGWKRYSNL
ncbi:phosphoribosylaminoimidazole carboxylase [Apostasia shenzhenica]|uniref:phosphoribosylaminoimidazole carboxylase n=1 Tax=Apostasia shenzhenica TaxID=1088818 RepID=A0A2I0B9P7_9ASPA|nr:phosphoribosylaminoimidazole carboxylase [Apostasia shenzhenica]